MGQQIVKMQNLKLFRGSSLRDRVVMGEHP